MFWPHEKSVEFNASANIDNERFIRSTKRPSLKSVFLTLCADLNINRLNEIRFNKTIASDAGVAAVH